MALAPCSSLGGGSGSSARALARWVFIEAQTHQVPWAAAYLAQCRLLLKHAVWVQAAVAGIGIAAAPRLRQIGLQACPDADQHYCSATWLLNTGIGTMLTGPLAAPEGAACNYLLTACVHLLLSYAWVLACLCRREWQQRRAFVRQQGLAGAMSELDGLQRGEMWQCSTLEWVVYWSLAWPLLLRLAAALEWLLSIV